MSTVVLDSGQQVQYADTGVPGPVVVLLHSFLMHGGMFAPQLASLGDAFRLVTVDERGHGGTPADQPFDYWDVARDVLGVLDALEVERAAVVGTSQGGFVALRLALLAPERVAAVAVLGSSADVQDPQIAQGYRALGQAWAEHGPQEHLLDTVEQICLGTTRADSAAAWREGWRQVPGERVLRTVTTLVERDGLLDRLPEVRCPVLVLHGSADAAYPVAHAQQVVDLVPDARPLVVVEGGHHFLSLTDAPAVDPHLRAFLQEVLAPQG